MGPGGEPLIPGLEEVLLGLGRSIQPRLAVHVVLEPAVGAADGDVEDEIEGLVEGCVHASLSPGVQDTSVVAVDGREVAALPHAGIEVDIQDLEETGIDVGEEILLRPLETEGVEILGISGVQGLALHVGTPEGVVGGVGTPVKR